MMETVISDDLVKEVTYIIKYDLVKAIIEELYDLPNKNLDLLIRLAIQNDGKIAVGKRKRFHGWIPENALIRLEQLISKALKEIKPE
ncbi:MAG: hypothetical protein ACI9SP_004357 [Arenicella sp.]|jgi:hypothetical protein